MAEPYERYVREIHSALHYWATWAPAKEIRLGQCGPIEDWVFNPERSVEDFGIEFEVDKGRATSPWNHTSEGATKVVFQVQGEAQEIPEIPAGMAGIKIGFERKDAVVFVAVDGREDRVRDILQLKRQVIAKAASREFPEDYVVVTNLVTAASATALISESGNASFVASAEADFKAGIVDLGNASLGIRTRVTENVRTELLARTHVTPLFNAFRLKANWWNDYSADKLWDDGMGEDDLPFEDVTPELFAAAR
jgi:hypothetical protein